MNSEKLLQLYGCKRHPFGPELRRALQPQNEEEQKLYAKVDGFGERVQFIQKWFAQRQNLEEGAIMMVYGPKGCGCSSVINYIVHHFCRAKQIKRQQVSRLDATVKDHHDIKPVQDVLNNLYDHLSDELGENIEKEHELLANWYTQYVFSPEKSTNEYMYRRLFSKTKRILKGYQRTPVIVLDKVRSYQQVENCVEVFKEAPLILLTTSNEDILNDFVANLHQWHGFAVKLRPLRLEDVKEFITQRWECLSDDQQHPFPEEGLEMVFDVFRKGELWPFRDVVNILTEVFEEHLKEISLSKLDEETSQPPPLLADYMFRIAIQYMIRVGIIMKHTGSHQ